MDHGLSRFRVGLFVPGLFGPGGRPTPDRDTVTAAHDVMFAEAGEEAGFEGLYDGPSPERSLDCIRQFGEQVLPSFHDDLPAD